MTYAQQVWLEQNSEFTTIGPPRPVQFEQWGTLSAKGEYERLDDKPRQPIRVGDGSIGVAVIKSKEGE